MTQVELDSHAGEIWTKSYGRIYTKQTVALNIIDVLYNYSKQYIDC